MGDHLKDNTPDAPQVGRSVVFLKFQNFRRHVQRRATQGFGHAGDFEVTGKPEIGYFEHRKRGFAVLVAMRQEKILGF